MRSLLILALAWLSCPLTSHAQVINIGGGESTIFGAEGGSATIYLPNSETRIGGGMMGGRPIFGLTETTRLHGYDLSAGDLTLPASLPSDFSGGSGFGFYGRGALIHQKHERGCSDAPKSASSRFPGYTGTHCSGDELVMFAGVTSQFFGFPMTFGSQSRGHGMALVSYERTLSQHWTFNSFEVVSTNQTAIQSLSWRHNDALRVSGSAGVGNSKPYAGLLFDLRQKYESLKIGYDRSAKDFRLLTLPNTLLVQNTGLSVQASVTPYNWLGFTGSQIHYQTPLSNSSLHSTVDTFGSFVTFRAFDLHATDFIGSTAGHRNGGQEFGGGIRLLNDAVSIRSEYSSSAYGRIVLNTISERITQKIRVSQYINTTAQGTTINVGGSYSGNAISASLSYAQEFYPFTTGKNPFATTLNASISFHIKNASVNLATLTNPGGRTQFTAVAGTYLYGPIESYGSGLQRHAMGGKFAIAGFVSLDDGSPVRGAAIAITDRKGRVFLVWSDSAGRFEAHVRSAQEYAVAVSLADFTTPERYAVRQCPAKAIAARDGQGEVLHVVLKTE